MEQERQYQSYGRGRRGSPNMHHGSGGRPMRQRSRSPPSYHGQRRFRRDDGDRYGGRDDGGGRHRHHGSRGGLDRPPLTFREFMADLPNDVSPEFAKAEYDRYLAKFWGNEYRAEFEQRKNDPGLRQRYDPREIQKLVEKKKALSQQAATLLKEHGLPKGACVPVGPYWYEGRDKVGDLNDDGSPEMFRKAFPVTHDIRAKYLDYKIAVKLVRALDRECEIEMNPLIVGQDDDMDVDGNAVADTEGVKQEEAQEDRVKQEEHDGQQEIAGNKEQKGNKNTNMEAKEGEDKDKKTKEEEEPFDAEAHYQVSDDFEPSKLDQLILYLWIVHGIDYYGSKEFGFEDDPIRKSAKRTMRPELEKKEDGTHAEDATVEDLRAHESRVAHRWLNRIQQGASHQKFLQTAKIEEKLQQFIDSQIIQHEEHKWGNKLSSKLFVEKKFVEKHIRNKHAHVVEAEKDRILEDIYMENYLNAKEREQRKHGGGGRGRGGRFGRGRGPMMFMDASQMMGAPIIMPTGGNQGVAPVIMMPMGGRGRGGRGRGGRGGFPNQQGYFDLDAPQNNRAMLDYGDL